MIYFHLPLRESNPDLPGESQVYLPLYYLDLIDMANSYVSICKAGASDLWKTAGLGTSRNANQNCWIGQQQKHIRQNCRIGHQQKHIWQNCWNHKLHIVGKLPLQFSMELLEIGYIHKLLIMGKFRLAPCVSRVQIYLWTIIAKVKGKSQIWTKGFMKNHANKWFGYKSCQYGIFLRKYDLNLSFLHWKHSSSKCVLLLQVINRANALSISFILSWHAAYESLFQKLGKAL